MSCCIPIIGKSTSTGVVVLSLPTACFQRSGLSNKRLCDIVLKTCNRLANIPCLEDFSPIQLNTVETPESGNTGAVASSNEIHRDKTSPPTEFCLSSPIFCPSTRQKRGMQAHVMSGNKQEQFICADECKTFGQPPDQNYILLAEIAATEQSVQMLALVQPVDPFRR